MKPPCVGSPRGNVSPSKVQAPVLFATSLFALQDAMGFMVPSSRWAEMVKRLKALPSYYGRTDLKKRSSWPTPCFDLVEVEQALVLMWPRKGKAILGNFKKKWNVK